MPFQTGGYAAHGARDGAQSWCSWQSSSAVDIGKHVTFPLLFFSRKGMPEIYHCYAVKFFFVRVHNSSRVCCVIAWNCCLKAVLAVVMCEFQWCASFNVVGYGNLWQRRNFKHLCGGLAYKLLMCWHQRASIREQKVPATVTVYRGHCRTFLYLPGIISQFIMCVGIVRNNSLVGGRSRAEFNPSHWTRHALLHMAARQWGQVRAYVLLMFF